MLISAIDEPTAVTPTIAQSMARLLNFSKPQPQTGLLGHPDLHQQLVRFQRRV